MFTGLVEGVGEIVGLTAVAEGLRLAVKNSFPTGELALGESVAVAVQMRPRQTRTAMKRRRLFRVLA